MNDLNLIVLLSTFHSRFPNLEWKALSWGLHTTLFTPTNKYEVYFYNLSRDSDNYTLAVSLQFRSVGSIDKLLDIFEDWLKEIGYERVKDTSNSKLSTKQIS